MVLALSERTGVVLRTTMIVGHPGEGEQEFRELLAFLEEARFERLGAFTYSEEEGTWGAMNLKDTIPQEEKQARYNELMRLQSQISLDYNLSRVGSKVEVMVDDRAGDYLVCRSEFESPEVDGEILVKTAEDIPVGSYINVLITAADEYDLQAVLL